MTTQELPTGGWDLFRTWISDMQGLSVDKDAYPLAADSLLAGDEVGISDVVSTAAVVRSLLDSAVDDLASAFALAADVGRLSPVGIPTLVRGSVELAGLGMWVLSGQGRQGRQERALRVAYDSFFNASKFFEVISRNNAAPTNVREEAAAASSYNKSCCETLLDRAVMGGLTKNKVKARLDRTGALKEVDAARETDFFSKWQLCSGFAHGLAWASQFFNTKVHVHTMEGGGLLTGRTLTEDRALVMLDWGRHAVDELTGTFAAARLSLPGANSDISIVSGPERKVIADAGARGIQISNLEL